MIFILGTGLNNCSCCKFKANIERALSEFLALAGQDNQRENVGAVLGMATAYMLLKQTPRARLVEEFIHFDR